MKKLWIILGILVVIVVLIYSQVTGTYNEMVLVEEGTKSSWSQVQNAYQRRLDLIPNLVNTVSGAADFEKSTLTAVIEARAKATQVNIDPTNISQEQIDLFQKSQNGLNSALSRLLVTIERYPDLKSSAAFRDLMTQLEGTENRISVERRNFNESVQIFNNIVRTFPNNFLAGVFGFYPKGYFQADAGAEKAPEVKFN